MHKYKVGDRVRIIDARMIEHSELGKVGKVVEINVYGDDDYDPTIIIDMGRQRRPHDDDDTSTRWWIRGSMVEKINEIGKQLLLFEV